jgi:thiosulfate/3-mercaptopyruvate sulfurtransferase
LNKIFYSNGLDPTLTTVLTSGSGISACILALALNVLDNDKASVYLGSWA